jgi:diadenosine tetraphosphate (Ap4A) HIT family hydrolase
MDGCAFCSHLVRDNSTEDWNRPLLESPNFVVLPSLGALVEGWLLIVPKKHFISLGALPDSLMDEFSALKCEVVQLTEEIYGSIALFEHGPSAAKHKVGCGVDHAHLHIVPVVEDLALAVASFLPEGARWQDANLDSCRTAFEQGSDYLYLEQAPGFGRIVVHDQLGSQLFRRAIAASSGIRDDYNWREHPQFANVRETIETVRKAIAAGSTCLMGSENAV